MIRAAVVTLVLCLIFALSGCEYIASALPPSPSPFPTMSHLPSVTPVTPSPTFLPTPTIQPTTPTPTSLPTLAGTVAVGANVRAGPGLDYAIVTSILAGRNVTIEGQRDGWYKVILPDETEGWMSVQVIEIEPAIATVVPTINAARQAD